MALLAAGSSRRYRGNNAVAMLVPTRHVHLASLLERIRPTYVDTFARENNDG